MRQTITVSKEDIEHGIPGSATSCPIALAARGPLSIDGDNISVGDRMLTASSTIYGTIYFDLPPRIRRWIRRFDHGAKSRPTKFEVEI